MKVLYISFHFAPFNHIGAIRSTKLCKYLHRSGEDIRVVSASNQPLPASLQSEFPQEKVIYSDWHNINSPFQFFFSNQKKVSENRSYLSKEQKEKKSIRKLVRFYKSVLYFPDDKIGWIQPAFSSIQELFRFWKPDIMYVSGGPFSSFLLARLVHSKYNIPWIAEYRDLWTQGHQYPFGNFRKTIEKKLEDWAVKTAKSFVTVSNPLADQLRQRFKKNVSVVTNAFDPEDQSHGVELLPEFPVEKLHIVYTGQIYIEHQEIAPLLAALKQSSILSKSVVLHFYGPNLKEKIYNRFGNEYLYDIGKNMIFYGLVDHYEALNVQKAADLLLLLGWTDKEFGGVLTGKIFEYMGSRKNILALNNHLDDASKLVVDNKVGYFCKHQYEVSKTLEKLLKLKQDGKDINPSSVDVEQFSYKVKAQQLLKAIKVVE